MKRTWTIPRNSIRVCLIRELIFAYALTTFDTDCATFGLQCGIHSNGCGTNAQYGYVRVAFIKFFFFIKRLIQ
jgi:hypothetical protein